jgi:ribonucleoside-diphosphate reductase alpha chain
LSGGNAASSDTGPAGPAASSPAPSAFSSGTPPTATATTTPASEGLSDLPHSAAPGTNGSSNGNGAAKAAAAGNGNGTAATRALIGNLGIGKTKVTFAAQADAPSCADCGSIMVRNGSCYKCLNCGSTSGCS